MSGIHGFIRKPRKFWAIRATGWILCAIFVLGLCSCRSARNQPLVSLPGSYPRYYPHGTVFVESCVTGCGNAACSSCATGSPTAACGPMDQTLIPDAPPGIVPAPATSSEDKFYEGVEMGTPRDNPVPALEEVPEASVPAIPEPTRTSPSRRKTSSATAPKVAPAEKSVENFPIDVENVLSETPEVRETVPKSSSVPRRTMKPQKSKTKTTPKQVAPAAPMILEENEEEKPQEIPQTEIPQLEIPESSLETPEAPQPMLPVEELPDVLPQIPETEVELTPDLPLELPEASRRKVKNLPLVEDGEKEWLKMSEAQTLTDAPIFQEKTPPARTAEGNVDPQFKRLSAEMEFGTNESAFIRRISAEMPVAGETAEQVVSAVAAVPGNEVAPSPQRPDFMPSDEYLSAGVKPAQKMEPKGNEKKLDDRWKLNTQHEEGTYLFYNSPEGRETVQTTDPVSLYAPRFRAVRQVMDLSVDSQIVQTGDIANPVEIHFQQYNTGPGTAKQQVQANQEKGKTVMTQLASGQSTGEVDGGLVAKAYTQDAVAAQEGTLIEGVREVDGKMSAWISEGMDRANTWTQNEELQVFIDKVSAAVSVKNESVPSIYTVQEGDKKPQMKIYKVASRSAANPGETVDFTIFFENVGPVPVGNVVLVDNLSARLEILEDSAESSVDALFSYEPNESGSLVLRWEVTQPLSPGEKGAVKFRCVVR
ncbi:MAG: hypothetical protein Q4D62_05940 [Planctomycetia bacterium]|nr:hypothetical protein [Planctomycetia bacterium]